MTKFKDLHDNYKSNLFKALDHLQYSFAKVKKLPTKPSELDEEMLETWESFSSRFARSVDIFTSKYIRSFVNLDDPGFEGSLRDFVNQAEKLNLIDSADSWMEARGLRNITAHEYKDESLQLFFKKLLEFTPVILKLKERL